MDTREAAQRWADVWERGWREHDAAAITALYAGGGTENLAGVSLLRFSDDGLVLEERDFWNQG